MSNKKQLISKKNQLIIKLANGFGIISPGGKMKWTYGEIGEHPEIKVCKQRVGEILKFHNAIPVKDNEMMPAIRAEEADKISRIMSRILDEIAVKDLKELPIDKLSWTLRQLSDVRDKKENQALDTINMAQIIKSIQDQERKQRKGRVIDVEAKEVKKDD